MVRAVPITYSVLPLRILAAAIAPEPNVGHRASSPEHSVGHWASSPEPNVGHWASSPEPNVGHWAVDALVRLPVGAQYGAVKVPSCASRLSSAVLHVQCKELGLLLGRPHNLLVLIA
jgi:hypothetical protein